MHENQGNQIIIINVNRLITFKKKLELEQNFYGNNALYSIKQLSPTFQIKTFIRKWKEKYFDTHESLISSLVPDNIVYIKV